MSEGVTDGPWIANDNHSGGGWRIETGAPGYPNDGWIIGDLHGPDAAANAALIARAVNGWDTVVEALERLIVAVGWEAQPIADGVEVERRALILLKCADKARKALQSAKGEA